MDAESEIKTYSLAEVAAMVLPDMARGERWLARRLLRGEISGYRIGRHWRMTHEDVENLIQRHRNKATSLQELVRDGPAVTGLTPPTSRRRLERGGEMATRLSFGA